MVSMPLGKSVSVSYRVSPSFKRLLEAAAAHEHRSQTNMLETILFDYCKEHGIVDGPDEASRESHRETKE